MAAGIVVVASAGNAGRTVDGRMVFGGVTSPGNDPSVLTVGAIDTHGTATREDDTVAPFSSRGPTRYDMVIKPDVARPRRAHRLGGGRGLVPVENLSRASRHGRRPRRVHAALRHEHVRRASSAAPWRCCSRRSARLKPVDVKAIVQLTSTFMPAAGLLTGGAGSLNAFAAAISIRSLLTNRASAGATVVRIQSRPAFSSTPFTRTRSSAKSVGSLSGTHHVDTSMCGTQILSELSDVVESWDSRSRWLERDKFQLDSSQGTSMDLSRSAKQLALDGRFADAFKVLNESGPGRRQAGHDVLRLEVLERLGRYGQCRALAESLFRSERTWTRRDRGSCEFVIGLVELNNGNSAGAVTRFHRAISLMTEAADLERRCWFQLRLLVTVADFSGPERAASILAELRATATKLGLRHITAGLHIMVGEMEAKRGLLKSADSHTKLGLQLLSASPNLWLETVAENTRVALAIMRSDFDAGFSHARRSLQLAEQSGSASMLARRVRQLRQPPVGGRRV